MGISTRLAIIVAVVATIGLWVYFDSVPLPDDPYAPQASEIYYRDGKTILARVGITDRTNVALAKVPVEVRRAVLAAEDRGFYDHVGVSGRGVVRAAWANVVSGGSEGASTITQQYARNAYLTQERNLQRKGKEMVLAIKLEQRYTKDEILERYLNAIYFGRGAYGISAASEAYFGIASDRLTLAQGAVLASVIKDPWNFDPSVDAEAAHERWRWIIASMAELGWVDQAVADALPFPDVLAEAPGSSKLGGPSGLIAGLVERELGALGISPQLLRTAGLRVVTTIDVTAQKAALDAVAATLAGQPEGLHAALVAMEPGNGAVRAYYGGDRGIGFFDDATAPRPAASTLKPVVLAAGLNRGVSYLSRWDGSSPRQFPDRGGAPLHNNDGVQCPKCTLSKAMVLSLNTPFYALAQQLGGSAIRDLAISLGVSPHYDGRPSLVDVAGDPRPGRTRADIALGCYPVSPVDMASLYATFASGGVRADRHMVESVWLPSRGENWHTAQPGRTRVLDANVAADVTAVLAEVVDHDGRPAGRWAAGKTGTQQWGNTKDNQDAWMAGYTAQLAAVVWIGRTDPGPIRDAAGRPIDGDGLPAALWRQFLSDALRGQPSPPMPRPAQVGRVGAGDATGPAVTPSATADGKVGLTTPSPQNVPPPENATATIDAPTSAPPTNRPQSDPQGKPQSEPTPGNGTASSSP